MSDRCQVCQEVPNPNGQCACPDNDLIRCYHCGEETDIKALTNEQLAMPTLPHTLTQLPDHNNVRWFCPQCKAWNNPSDSE